MGAASSDVTHRRYSIQADDGQQICIDAWRPADETNNRGVIQVLHGLSEHSARYERLAIASAAKGLAVVAHNHRGHGDHCSLDELGHYADRDGWNKVINDSLNVRAEILAAYPDLPLILLGHSMGSYIAQACLMRDSANVDALILSATTSPNRSQLRIARSLARLAILLHGGRHKSVWLNRLGFGAFNRQFEPARTPLDWLSRDEAVVDAYVADLACGAPSSNRLWYDLTGGLLEISSRGALDSVPCDLPILIMGGQADPVGGENGLSRLATAYRNSNHSDVELRIYPMGRHEMLNEINRDEVTQDLLRWIEKHTL